MKPAFRGHLGHFVQPSRLGSCKPFASPSRETRRILSLQPGLPASAPDSSVFLPYVFTYLRCFLKTDSCAVWLLPTYACPLANLHQRDNVHLSLVPSSLPAFPSDVLSLKVHLKVHSLQIRLHNRVFQKPTHLTAQAEVLWLPVREEKC